MTKKKHFILLLNKMCMNLKNAHPFTESAEGNVVHSHHGVLWVLALHHPAHLGQAASQGPHDPRSGTHFCCKSLGGFVSQKIRQEKSAYRANAIFWLPYMKDWFKKPDQSFTLETIVFNWSSGCLVVRDTSQLWQKRASLLSPFPTQTGCVYTDKFVFTCFLVVIPAEI